MKGNDDIKDLFSEKLGGLEAKVNPELWGKVASQIGAGSTAAATGMSIVTKAIIGVTAASVITVALFNTEKAPENKIAKNTSNTPIEVQKEDVTIETPNTKLSTDKSVVMPTKHGDYFPSENQVTEPVLIDTASNLVSLTDPVVTNPVQIIEKPAAVTWKNPDPATEPTVIEPDVNDELLTPATDIITEESLTMEIEFPNVFTPNGDGVNDALFIKNPSALYNFGIVILDNTGQEVYKSTDANFKWFGDRGGDILPAGTYIAMISCEDANGKQVKPVIRSFTIVR